MYCQEIWHQNVAGTVQSNMRHTGVVPDVPGFWAQLFLRIRNIPGSNPGSISAIISAIFVIFLIPFKTLFAMNMHT
jgi:hypothetical protein